MGVKMGLWISMVMLLVLAACTQNGQVAQDEQKNENQAAQDQTANDQSDSDQTGDGQTGNDQTGNGQTGDQSAADQADGTQAANDPVRFFTQIHGLAYGLQEPYDLFMSTPHGIIHINHDSGDWQWAADGIERHDLTGFAIQDENTMIASGRPAEHSPLQDPLGVVVSQDQGRTWEPVALHGEVDFHVLEMNAGDPSILYAITEPNFEFYRSKNGGLSWEKVPTTRLSPDTHALVSDPGHPEVLLAGTQKGILKSEDGGETWEMFNPKQTFVGVQGVPRQAGVIVAYLLGDMEGLMLSEDFGNTWSSLHLSLENDAVSSIAIHPEQEGIYTVGTLEEDVYQTTDGGENWKPVAKSGKPLN